MLVDYLNQQRELRGWSIREFAGFADVSHSGLARILRGEVVPTVKTIEKLAHGLEVEHQFLMRLLVESHYLSQEVSNDVEPSVRLLVERLSSLSPELREELVEVFRIILDVVSRAVSTKKND